MIDVNVIDSTAETRAIIIDVRDMLSIYKQEKKFELKMLSSSLDHRLKF